MSDLSKIEVELLGIDTPEKYLEVRRKVEFAKGLIKTLDALLGEKALEIVEAWGPIQDGEFIHKIVTEATYKPVMKSAQMAQEILAALGGDWDAFSACLASGAFKHGQLRKLLEDAGQVERFSQFFERVEKKTVEGKPVKRVVPVNQLFAAKSA